LKSKGERAQPFASVAASTTNCGAQYQNQRALSTGQLHRRRPQRIAAFTSLYILRWRQALPSVSLDRGKRLCDGEFTGHRAPVQDRQQQGR
jgi:hypothetical protein